jgi:hypothetical protein
VHIKAVADLLGHSSIAISGDFYSLTSDASTRAAVGGPTSTLDTNLLNVGQEVVCSHALRGGDWAWLA